MLPCLWFLSVSVWFLSYLAAAAFRCFFICTGITSGSFNTPLAECFKIVLIMLKSAHKKKSLWNAVEVVVCCPLDWPGHSTIVCVSRVKVELSKILRSFSHSATALSSQHGTVGIEKWGYHGYPTWPSARCPHCSLAACSATQWSQPWSCCVFSSESITQDSTVWILRSHLHLRKWSPAAHQCCPLEESTIHMRHLREGVAH